MGTQSVTIVTVAVFAVMLLTARLILPSLVISVSPTATYFQRRVGSKLPAKLWMPTSLA